MPPKNKYQRDEVISAAIRVVEEKGMNSLTARRVATRLCSSTAPVYQHFATMEDLNLAVIRETQKKLLEYTVRPYTDRVFLNIGTGIGMFAMEHSQLYRALMLEGDSYRGVIRETLDIMETQMIADGRFASLSGAERHSLLMKMWTFTHGLASLICVGLIKDCSKDSIIEALSDIGADVISATLAKNKKSTEANSN